MLYRITHSTRYAYPSPVTQCFNEARLTPRALPGQRVREHSLKSIPFRPSCKIASTISATMFPPLRFLKSTTASRPSPPAWWKWSRRAGKSFPPRHGRRFATCWPSRWIADSIAASEFIFDSPYISALAELREYARPTFTPGRPLLSALQELTRRIHDEFKYQPKSTSIDTPLLEVLRNRQGVCQDFAHLMIGALRSLRLSARYVSGYIRSSPRFQGAAASHAWVSVFDPQNGWLSFDPTNNMMPSDAHITLAWGRDYGDVTPVKGLTLGGGGQSVEVEVRVQPLEG